MCSDWNGNYPCIHDAQDRNPVDSQLEIKDLPHRCRSRWVIKRIRSSSNPGINLFIRGVRSQGGVPLWRNFPLYECNPISCFLDQTQALTDSVSKNYTIRFG